MEELRWIGFGAFLAVSSVVGIRLVLLARRSAEIPELLVGATILGLGPLGYGLGVLAWATAGSQTILSASARGAATLAICIGAASFYVFMRTVFCGRSRWAGIFTYAAIAALAVCCAGDILERGLVNRGPPGRWYLGGMGLRLFVLGWGALESLVTWQRMRRRVFLGLADQRVTGRFLLWGLGTGATFLGHALAAAVQAASRGAIAARPGFMLAVTTLGFVSALAMWFAFQPPAFAARWLAKPAGAVPSGFD